MTRQHRRGGRAVVILLLLVILALAVISGLLALKLSRREEPRLAGVWQMRAELTDTARTRADTWLQRAAMGEQVPAADYLPPLSVTVRLTLSKDGSWSREIRDGEYETARTAAEKGLAGALRELLCLRIADAGRPPETAAEAEERVQRVLGMSTEDYMREYGPALLPPLAEMHDFYDGGGSYRADTETISFDGEAVRYLADDGLLVLLRPEGAEVYERA